VTQETDSNEIWHVSIDRGYTIYCQIWQPPQFSAHDVYCSQTAGWIKMALGMEVGLGPGHTVLDGDPAPLPQKGAELPISGPFLL